MPFLETSDGTHLFYQDWGTGTPVVFAASWTLYSTMWEYQIPMLVEQGLRCITYDRRGHGRSDLPGHGYDFDTLADDLATLIEHLDLHDVILVGHSMGGGEIVRYLSRHGSKRIAKAALLSAIVPGNDSSSERSDIAYKTFIAEICPDRPKYFSDRAQSFFATHLGNQISIEIIEWLVEQCLATPSMASLQTMHAILHANFRAEMQEITLPTLIIHGTADTSTPIEATGRQSAQLLPNNEFKEYKNAGHGLFITHKDRLNNDLLAFIQG